MGDICNSKMETGNNISTILKNFKNAENIIIHIDKNINNLNKGIDVRFRTFAQSTCDNFHLNQKFLHLIFNFKF